ncbi:MAG TPA: nitrogenase component 1 [Myxococcota bacterium]|nr:nitrogenase component 1 [Myxococcota bacterium]
MESEKRPEESDQYLFIPYLTGVYLAVNAISDAYLVVDGPNCVFFRVSQIQGNHDWHSTLSSCTGLHRVADTDCTTERAAAGDARLLVSRLQEVDAIEACSLILLTAMSPVAVTSPQYDQVIKSLPKPLAKPIVQVRSGSLTGDWLHGYAATLEDLATRLELDSSKDPEQDDVAIVGYLMDRNEADHTANLDEISRLLDCMDLRLVSCWLSGGDVSNLQAVGRAGTILSFPYARRAAKKLAERTGAKLVECELPLGPGATCEWLRSLGRAVGKETLSEKIIDAEMSQVAPKLEWILQRAFVGKVFAQLGSDPFLLEALEKALAEFGCRVGLSACFSHRDRLGVGEEGTLMNPSRQELQRSFERLLRLDDLDLVIVNSRVLRFLDSLPRRLPFIELGFPSFYTHALFESPFLGFRGALRLVERMANAISQAAALNSDLY